MVHKQKNSTLGKNLPSLKLTASLHLKMDGWNTIYIISFWGKRPIFRGELAVSFKERGKLSLMLSS